MWFGGTSRKSQELIELVGALFGDNQKSAVADDRSQSIMLTAYGQRMTLRRVRADHYELDGAYRGRDRCTIMGDGEPSVSVIRHGGEVARLERLKRGQIKSLIRMLRAAHVESSRQEQL